MELIACGSSLDPSRQTKSPAQTRDWAGVGARRKGWAVIPRLLNGVPVAVEETVPLEEVGELTLKGLTQPVVAYNVPLTAIQPSLRVIEGGGPQCV